MHVVGTIEARMGSTRLPGKTLMEIHDGMPLLECVVRRFRLAELVDEVVVATTTAPGDDPVADWCDDNVVSVFRGSEDDVLDRVAGAASASNADAIVQMGADSAYLDYQLIDQLVTCYIQGAHDYVCNDLNLSYPLGIYAHVVKATKLIELNRHTDLTGKDREDVVRYIWEHPQNHKIVNLEAPAELHYPELRLTVDYPDDLTQAKAVYDYFGDYRFTTKEIVNLYRQKPAMFEATSNLAQHSAPFLLS